MPIQFDTDGLDNSMVAVAELLPTNEHAATAEFALDELSSDESDLQEAEANDQTEPGGNRELLASPENQTQPLEAGEPSESIQSAKVENEATEEQTPAQKQEAEKRAKLLADLRRKRYEVAAWSIGLARLKAEVKGKKKHLDLATDELSRMEDDVMYELNCEYHEINEMLSGEEPAEVADLVQPQPPAMVVEAGAATETAQASAAKTSWRDVPTTEIDLAGIKGLGEKKLDELIHECPTIGKLEDLRASHEGLRKLKGIGQKTSDEIENRILDWLSKNRDSAVLATSSEPPTTQPPATPSEPEPIDLSDL